MFSIYIMPSLKKFKFFALVSQPDIPELKVLVQIILPLVPLFFFSFWWQQEIWGRIVYSVAIAILIPVEPLKNQNRGLTKAVGISLYHLKECDGVLSDNPLVGVSTGKKKEKDKEISLFACLWYVMNYPGGQYWGKRMLRLQENRVQTFLPVFPFF